jgi:hypothetical protein
MQTFTASASEKLYNLAELLQTPSFPSYGWGSWKFDSLKILEENLRLALDATELSDAFESLIETRDALTEQLDEAQDKVHIFCLLAVEVRKLEEDDAHELTKEEFSSLINKYAKQLGTTDAQAEVRSWFNLKEEAA